MSVTVENGDRFLLRAPAEEEPMQPIPSLVIEANGKTFVAGLADNSSAEALVEKLTPGPVTVDMHDYGSFEKIGPLPWSLPRNDEQITTAPGDVILYQGNQITIYYDQNTWEFTRLAEIEGLCLFGSITVHFEREYRELLWNKGDEKYYPKGVDDEDYCILEFIAEGGRFYRYDGKGDLSAYEIETYDRGRKFVNGYKASHADK